MKVRCRVMSCVAGRPRPCRACLGWVARAACRGPVRRLPARVVRYASWPGSGGVVHDAVVAAAGAGAAGAGAVAGEHLGGGPAVEFHLVAFGSAAVGPGVAEVRSEEHT